MPLPRARLGGFGWTAASAFAFAALLLLVRMGWPPLESVDRSIADRFNRLVTDESPLLFVFKGITWLGSNGVLWSVIVGATVILAIRRLYRLALYTAVAGAGSLVLDPIIKALVGRLRPVVEHPVAYGTGSSFPSGHSLGSFVCYGAVLLVFLPAVPRRFRTWAVATAGVLVGLVGLSRLMLGVHYLSDVVGAWALGVVWLSVTAYAFEIARQSSGQPVTQPLAEGLEPEASDELTLTEPEPRATKGSPRATAAGVLVGWVLILGVIVGLGELVTKFGNGNVLGDRAVPAWLAARRTDTLTRWSDTISTLGATTAVVVVAVATCLVAVAVLRRWRPVVFMVAVMVGEVTLFLITSAVVRRPRPEVPQLDEHLPTFAFPSGHIAATACVYIGLAVLVIGHARGWWRWLFLAPAIVMPALVALSRLYRGEHHPTDVLGSLLFVALWLPLVYKLIRPNADREEADVRTASTEKRPEPAVVR